MHAPRVKQDACSSDKITRALVGKLVSPRERATRSRRGMKGVSLYQFRRITSFAPNIKLKVLRDKRGRGEHERSRNVASEGRPISASPAVLSTRFSRASGKSRLREVTLWIRSKTGDTRTHAHSDGAS